MRSVTLSILLLLIISKGFSQQPFEAYGYKVKVATLSKGEYTEFFDQDTLVQIGSVILNTVTGKLIYFVTTDTTYSEANLQPELISRWLSPDPHTEKYYSFSPYNFAVNNPILFNDPDGRDIAFYILSGSQDDSRLQKVSFNQLDKNFQKALISFAKTKVGFAYLSQFAKKGDMIGNIKFGADGKFAKHDLELTQEKNYTGSPGRNNFTWSTDGSKATFYLQVNTVDNEGDRTDLEQAITVGHESLIHMDQYDDKVVDAANNKDKSTLSTLHQQHQRNGADGNGRVDHQGYINGDPQYQKMNSYSSQLKSIYNPEMVDKKMKEHDKAYQHLRKK